MGVAGRGCPRAAPALLLPLLLLTAAVPPDRGRAAGPPEGECPAAGTHLARRAGRAPGRVRAPSRGVRGAREGRDRGSDAGLRVAPASLGLQPPDRPRRRHRAG